MSELTAAEKYRQAVESSKAETETIIAPSGFPFVFYKQDTTALLFEDGDNYDLPQTITNEAAEEWERQGLIPPTEESEVKPVITQTPSEIEREAARMQRIAEARRDRVLTLSHTPKLVMGKADESKGEMSVNDVLPTDLAYLYKWVSAGGSQALMSVMFPQESRTNSGAGINGAELRAKAKRNSRHKK